MKEKIKMSELTVGDTFLTKKSQSELYMVTNIGGYKNSKIAVNLAGGQIRDFKDNTLVIPVKTEVRVLK